MMRWRPCASARKRLETPGCGRGLDLSLSGVSTMTRLFFIGLLGLLLAGCGSGLKTVPVSGTITKDGQPLADVSVTFTPLATGGEAPASNGRTDSSGKYTLKVTVTGDSGAVPGNHIVSIAAIGSEGAGNNSDIADPNWVDPIPPHSLTFEVKPGGTDQADFDLKTK
jgi:hypothetical protein